MHGKAINLNTEVLKFTMLRGKTLIIGPSRSGKSYYSNALKKCGVHVVDADHDTDLLKWRNVFSGKQVSKPFKTDELWLASNRFMINADELKQFLNKHNNVIIFANCWNIMDTIDQFDSVAYLSIELIELERRLIIERADHQGIGSEAEVQFFRDRFVERNKQARLHNIPTIDATLSVAQFYKRLNQIICSK